MLLRLVSNPPLPTILFTLAFANLPDTIPYPPNWIVQLHNLADDDLELPDVTHVLDKSTWIISLLEQVTFDLTCLTVSCAFVDGTKEEWPLMQHKCTELLESIQYDVKQSSVEDHTDSPIAPIVPSSPSPASPTPTKKHKKSRSLLMSIVSTFVPSISLSSPVKEFTPIPPSVPAPSLPPASPVKPAVSRSLRRRARSNLVEAYRRFVANELLKRAKPGGYYTWIAESLLRRKQDQMYCLVERAGGIVPELNYDYSLVTGVTTSPFCSHYATRSTSTYGEDDGDGHSIAGTTDTDGSSIHTPTESYGSYRPHLHYPTDFPRTPSPPNFSPDDFELYASLNKQCLRLRQILYRVDVYQSNLAAEENHILSVLEIKSRRRSWSNRQYCGGAPVAYLGLATPFRSSPLAKWEPVTSDDWEETGTNLNDCFQMLSISTGDHDLSDLFPHAVEESHDVPENYSIAGVEIGSLKSTRDGLERISPMRMKHRTKNPLDLDGAFSPQSPRLSSSSLLCQSFNPSQHHQKETLGKKEAIYQMDLPPAYFAREEVQGIPSFKQDWIRPPSIVEC